MTSERNRKMIAVVLNVIFWIFLMFPLIFAFMTAIKPAAEIYDPTTVLLPKNPTFSNFTDVFKVAPIGRYIFNSMVVSIAIAVLQIVTSLLAGFGFKFLDFKGQNILYALVISTMMIPGESVIISQFLMVSGWGWIDTMQVLIVPFIVSAFNIFLVCQSLESFPYEVYEAAKMDGCSNVRFVFTILTPLLKPTIGSMAVRSFLSGWNMYMWPLLVTNNDSVRTVQIGISMLNSIDSQSMVLMIAGVVLCMIPSLFIFVVGQRNMVKGLTAGAVKG